MNVVYLDQNIVIDLVERSADNSQIQRTRDLILRLVEAGNAIFPYSEIHQWESRGMAPDSKKRIGEFWDTISRGCHYSAGKDIRALQFKDVLHGRKTRFSPHLVVFRGSLKFTDLVGDLDPALKSIHAQQFRAVAERWAGLTDREMDGHIRREEAATLARMVMDMFTKVLSGELPSLSEIFSEYNTIASDLSWEFRAKGENDGAFFKAVAFMRERALDVHAIAIESVGLESLARQYAIDNTRVRAVADARLDHDCNDLAALSNFVPYCVAAISDGNAVNVVRKAYKELRKTPPILFTRRELEEFTKFLEGMPPPEGKTGPDVEAARSTGQTLFTIPWKKHELIQRELLKPIGDIKREILPFGGLKVWSDANTDWPKLLAALETSFEETKSELGGEAVLYGARSSDGVGQILFDVRVPFGMITVCRDEIENAFASVRSSNCAGIADPDASSSRIMC
jgi:hypothetical protein